METRIHYSGLFAWNLPGGSGPGDGGHHRKRGPHSHPQCLKTRQEVALSNKEPIVMAGGIIKEYEQRYGGTVLPVDSEPSAIWQCLRGEDNQIRRLLITASGGPFRPRRFELLLPP